MVHQPKLADLKQARCGSDVLKARALSWRRDRQAAHAVALDQARDQSRCLRRLHELAQEGGTGRVLAGRADGLLHGHELPIEDARTR